MKILIISHNCFSTYSNMGKTLMSLFGSFSKSELCQLYIFPSLPDKDICSSYYRVTDKDILRSLFLFRKPGAEINPELQTLHKSGYFEDPRDAAIYGQKRNSTAYIRLARDFMWKFSNWYTKSLQEWLERENPQCIFLAPGYAKFIYDIALVISQKRNIPIVTYICDDYYFVNQSKLGIDRIQLKLLKKKTEELMKNTAKLVLICEELRVAYSSYFGICGEVVMTGFDGEEKLQDVAVGNGNVVSYFGNLKCNRISSLMEFGYVLDQLNEKYDTRYILNVYSAETDEGVLKDLCQVKAIQFKGFVSGIDFTEAMKKSDYLLHVEAFDEASVDLVKHSISTKIAESLACGIPLIAYGPEKIASMKHLIRNKCALVITDQHSIASELLSMNHEKCREITLAARETAAKYHSCHLNGVRVRNILEEVIMENSK